tara:strand:+ start:16600 stop:16782 length:183 start_codon:yes stop_codon:yes gene_type:complete
VIIKMAKRLIKGHGIPLTVWVEELTKEERSLATWKIWRDFYECGMTPSEALSVVKGEYNG